MNTKTQIVMLPAECLEHHPENPRKEIGDISELTESIKTNGILQNLTVVPNPDNEEKYFVVIGNRRYEAGTAAGLKEFPCVISDMSHTKQLETMLIENMNRSDLTVYEQAKGFEQLTLAGYSIDDIADKTGFSKSTVRRRINLCQYDESVITKAFEGQATFEDFEKLNQIKDENEKQSIVEYIGTNNFNWHFQSALENQRGEERAKIVLDAIKDIARPLKSGEGFYSLDYVTTICLRKDLKEYPELFEKLEEIKSLPKAEYVYDRNYIGNFDIRKVNPEKANEESKPAAEPKYQKDYEEIKALTSEMRERHFEFIKNYNKKPKSVPGIALLCLDTISKLFTTDGVDGTSSVDTDDLLNFTADSFRDKCTLDDDSDLNYELSEYYKSNIPRFFVNLTAAFIDVNGYSRLWQYGGNTPIVYGGNESSYTYDDVQKIKIFADFIERLGYVMSDEEKQLIDGTHRLYHLEDSEEAEQ